MRVARKLQYGCTWINTHFMLVNEMPHGGLKSSGYGKDMSLYALEDYTCLLYTSDAADERSSVDLGGRRIIKKKTADNHSCQQPS